MADVISLAEYKQLKGINDNTSDVQLEMLIEMVSEAIQSYCNRTFGVGNHVEQNEGVVDYQGRFFFKVVNRPIAEVQSVQVKFYGTQQILDIDVDKLDLFAKEGYAYYCHAYDFLVGIIRTEHKDNFYYTIAYSGGQPVPKAVKLAAATAIGDLYEMLSANKTVSGEVNKELSSIKIGDYSESYNTSSKMFNTLHDKNTGAIFSQTVVDLLAPYVYKGQSW